MSHQTRVGEHLTIQFYLFIVEYTTECTVLIMETTKEKHAFWSTLEADLSLEIPNHIKTIFRLVYLYDINFFQKHIKVVHSFRVMLIKVNSDSFSLYGSASAIAFKSITDDDIREVEDFVRNDLLNIIESTAIINNENLTEEKLALHFGNFYLNPENFEFSMKEKQQIFKCVKHVNYKVDLDGVDENLAHFGIEEHVKAVSEKMSMKKSEVEAPQTHTHTVLNKLLHIADQNAERKKEGYRFDEDVKSYAAVLRMISGPYAYETLQRNLELCLPTLSSVNRYIRKTSNNIIEGVIRSQELAVYLEKRNLPPIVSLSEDATRITGTVQYDVKTNQLIGFVLPINDENGMPIPYSFPARNANEILQHFTAEPPIGHFVNIVMAQPLGRASPFCLLLNASDSKYTAEHVADKWKCIVNDLRTENITVLTISSDSDPKFNAAMRINSNLGKPSKLFGKNGLFCCGTNMDPPFYIQDIVHIATNLRNLLLRTLHSPEKLRFGNEWIITIDHLRFLINNFTKDKHMLTASTINPEDRQNFSSVKRMCDDKVINLLKSHVQGAFGTATFLELIRDIIDSFLDRKLLPLQRVRKIWYVVFVLRLWREYVKSQRNLSLSKNFLTANCYICIELCAHSLVLTILYLKNKNMAHTFIPDLYTSQICEETFRKIRSFTTVYSTVANCSIKEIIGRLDKIQLQSDLSLNTDFVFPRSKTQPIANDSVPQLPTKDEICQEIEKCKLDAMQFARSVGLISNNISPNMMCNVSVYRGSDWFYLPDENPVPPLRKFYRLELRDYSIELKNKVILETSPYVQVDCVNKTMIVKKSSLCWLLRSDTHKLSSDRLNRVKSKYNSQKKSIRKPNKKPTGETTRIKSNDMKLE